MKAVFDKLPLNAELPEVIRSYNALVDKLNLSFDNIDEENLSEAILEKMEKEEK